MGDFRREFRIFFGIVFLTLAFVIGASIYFKLDSIHRDHQLREQASAARALAASNKRVLCSLHDTFAARIPRDQAALNRSKEFSRKHPHGAFGFSHAAIEAGIRDDKATLDNLKDTTEVLSHQKCAKMGGKHGAQPQNRP